MDLQHRYQVEKEYHDRKATDNTRTGFYAWGVLSKADRYAYALLGDLQGKVVLDLGCGGGHHAVRFAERGAIEDIVFFAEPFSALSHREFYLLALAALALLPLKRRGAFQRTLNWLSRLDDSLFSRRPTIRRYAWVTVFEVIK